MTVEADDGIPRPPRRPAAITARTPEARGAMRREIRLDVITPLFGGGVHVDGDPDRRQLKRPDPVTPIRGASIRGQLRFWWRATRGSACPTVAAMRALEADLWGAASSPARVAVAVRGSVATREVPVFEMAPSKTGKWNARSRPGMRSVAYAAFPLQPPGSKPTRLEPGALHAVVGRPIVEVTFEPRGMAPDEASLEWAGVQRAIDAWLAFGGLGGRTRRGFGALAGDAPTDPVALLAALQPHSGPLTGLPTLTGAEVRVMGRRFPDAMQALSTGIERLRTFRQGEDVGRNPGQEPQRPGRSRWPEPELIRALTGQSAPAHRQRLVGVDKTPRAAFGLPIIFHFKDAGEPGDTTLTPTDAHRRASPLIIRPYRVDDRYDVLALRLGGERTGPLTLSGKGGPWPTDATLDPAEARRIRPLAGDPDALGAFLDFFTSTD